MIIYPIPPKELDDKTLSKQIKNIRDVLVGVVLEARGDVNPYSPEGIKLTKCYYRIWAKECRANYLNLVEMGLACCEEITYRYSGFKKDSHLDSETKEWMHKNNYRAVVQSHKLQPVIEWARDNVPELPDLDCTYCGKGYDAVSPCKEYNDKMSLCDSNYTTPFPITIPSKYIEYLSATGRENTPRQVDIEQSYRNYYRAKLQKKVKCPRCKNTKAGPYVVLCRCSQGYLIKDHTWTRREVPSYIAEVIND